MIQEMRELGKSWVVKTLMGLLVVSFAIWGIGDMFRGNPLQRTVAKAGGISITVQDLEQEFQQNVSELRKNFGPDITPQQAKQMGLLDRTLASIVERSVMNQAINAFGIKISEKTVLKKIADQPVFRDEKGKFNTQLWQAILRQHGVSEAQFIQNERTGEAQQALATSLIANKAIPKTLIDNLYSAYGQKRILEILSFPDSSVGSIPAPDEETLKHFYSEHSDKFNAPEYRSITIARLSFADASKDLTISEEDLKKAYDEKVADFTTPEQRDLSQVVLQDEAKAKEISEAAQNEGDFAKTAKSKGYNAVSIDKAEEKSLLPEIFKAVSQLGEKQVSSPIKTDLGWHVVYVKKIYPSVQPAFSDIKEKLKNQLQGELAADAVTRSVNQLDDALAAGRQLEEVADSLKLRLIKIQSLTSEGATLDGKTPAEFPAKDEVIKAAFNQASGETSQVIEDKSEQGSNYIVVRTDDVVPEQVRPYDKARPLALTLWSADAQSRKARETAEKIAQSMREGKAASTFAARSGVDVRLSKPISLLGETDKDIPGEAMQKIMQMQKGDIITTSSDGRQYVIKMAEIEKVNPAKPGAGYKVVSSEIEKQLANDILNEYYLQMRQRFTVKINGSLLDDMRQQGNQ